ncbi:MAG: hypothetical protein LBH47_00150 [Christensenellaceae bacterium]|jgi:hypothetical protein|nr:hypothetical protein [Christensenellaceae bacterium]
MKDKVTGVLRSKGFLTAALSVMVCVCAVVSSFFLSDVRSPFATNTSKTPEEDGGGTYLIAEHLEYSDPWKLKVINESTDTIVEWGEIYADRNNIDYSGKDFWRLNISRDGISPDAKVKDVIPSRVLITYRQWELEIDFCELRASAVPGGGYYQIDIVKVDDKDAIYSWEDIYKRKGGIAVYGVGKGEYSIKTNGILFNSNAEVTIEFEDYRVELKIESI